MLRTAHGVCLLLSTPAGSARNAAQPFSLRDPSFANPLGAAIMSKAKILLQLDPDPHASVFDAVVAIDAGIDHLLPRQDVEPSQVRDLVHGAIFTRGLDDLHQTAIFVGGSNVVDGEAILEQVKKTFFGPMRVSVMFDANG